jgi:threonyl-tRNA synthetase
MKVFGFNDVSVELSTRPDKFIGSIEDWVLATSSLEQSLKDKRIQYHICEGEGAFYGPKIDIKLKDALGRLWQCATIQCDFALPKRFDLKYVDSDGQEKQPIMLHRVLLGSVERFIGALTEHYAGDFPLWLAPVQVIIIPIAEKHIGYAQEIGKILAENDIRCEVNSENETLGKKIRSSELTKVPYIFVVGDKELESKTISVRKRKSSKQESAKIDDLARLLREQIINKN